MRAVVQLVSSASVTVEGQTTGAINKGLVVLLGISQKDTRNDALYLADKIVNLRIFPDGENKMNLSVKDVGGGILVVSQFTLYGDCRKGRRPSYSEAGGPAAAKELYVFFIDTIRTSGLHIACGIFQAMMAVSLVNDGPVTLLLDSEKCF